MQSIHVVLAREDSDGSNGAERIFATMPKEETRLQPPSGSSRRGRLSAREREVLSLIGDGAKNTEIARRLFITLNTTKKHITHILHKLDVPSRDAAVRRARDLGLLA